MTLPLKVGGTTVTILHETEDAFGDKTWVDGPTITGCMVFPSFSSSGRIVWRARNTTGGQDVITDMQTLYLPYGTAVGPTDRVLIHPAGMATVPAGDTVTRRENSYDILGEPMQWQNMLTGWKAACEVALTRVF